MENESLYSQKQDLESMVQKLRDEVEVIRTMNASLVASEARSAAPY
ncbi:MAG: hypothetical protein ACPIOQ_11985 [Promethearchaeia archaeon]|jgi:hypothetical protein